MYWNVPSGSLTEQVFSGNTWFLHGGAEVIVPNVAVDVDEEETSDVTIVDGDEDGCDEDKCDEDKCDEDDICVDVTDEEEV